MKPQPSPGTENPGLNSRTLCSVDAGVWRISEKVYRPGAVMPKHAHHTSNLSFVLGGALEETSGSAVNRCRAGSWVVKPAGTEHDNRVGPRGARLLELVLQEPPAGRELVYGWSHGGPEATGFLKVYRELRLGGSDAPLILTGLCESLAENPGRGSEREGPAWVPRVAERIRDTGGVVGSLASLAGEFHVHPTYLARVFRRCFGCTVGEYARGVKLGLAARMLGRQTTAPLSEIALTAGFADQSHFTRVFQAHTRLTPARYRRLLRS
jgi:AraC family transcriptional regulator